MRANLKSQSRKRRQHDVRETGRTCRKSLISISPSRLVFATVFFISSLSYAQRFEFRWTISHPYVTAHRDYLDTRVGTYTPGGSFFRQTRYSVYTCLIRERHCTAISIRSKHYTLSFVRQVRHSFAQRFSISEESESKKREHQRPRVKKKLAESLSVL